MVSRPRTTTLKVPKLQRLHQQPSNWLESSPWRHIEGFWNNLFNNLIEYWDLQEYKNQLKFELLKFFDNANIFLFFAYFNM